MTRVVLCVQNMDVPDDPRVWNEATSLAGAGYDVTVVAPRSSGAPDSERIDGVAALIMAVDQMERNQALKDPEFQMLILGGR